MREYKIMRASAALLLTFAACEQLEGSVPVESDADLQPSAGPAETTAAPMESAGVPEAAGGAPALDPPNDQKLVVDDPVENTPPPNPTQSPPDDASCGSARATSAPIDAVLQLVVDTSSSMNSRSGAGLATKLAVTKQALAQAILGMSDNVYVGLIQYPGVRSLGPLCQAGNELVPLARLDDAASPQRARLENALLGLTAAGSTPTYEAFRKAFDTLVSFKPPELGPANRFVVLLTDGAPGTPNATACALPEVDGGRRQNVADALVDVAKIGLAERVATFVLGSPGSENARPALSRMAEAGGTARAGCAHDGEPYCHFDMTAEPDFGEALNQALLQVTRRAVSCSYPIPKTEGVTVDRNRVNVQFKNGDAPVEDILYDGEADCEEGWYYSGENVQLCAATCSRVQTADHTEIELLFGCKTKVGPPRVAK